MRLVVGRRPYLGPEDLRDMLQPSALDMHPGRVFQLLAEVVGRARGNTHARQGMRNYWWRVNRNFISCYGYGKPLRWDDWPAEQRAMGVCS